MKIPTRMLGAALLLGTTMVLAVRGDPTLDDQLGWRQEEFDRRLGERAVQIDPAELRDLMHDRLVRLRIVDVRDEADFNLFHLADAERVPCAALRASWGRELPAGTIVVVVGNDEARAEASWRILTARGVPNVYVLAGGLNLWMELHGDATVRPRARSAPVAHATTEGADACFREEPFLWVLPAALGDRHPAALPPPQTGSDRTYQAKVVRTTAGARPTGGCG